MTKLDLLRRDYKIDDAGGLHLLSGAPRRPDGKLARLPDAAVTDDEVEAWLKQHDISLHDRRRGQLQDALHLMQLTRPAIELFKKPFPGRNIEAKLDGLIPDLSAMMVWGSELLSELINVDAPLDIKREEVGRREQILTDLRVLELAARNFRSHLSSDPQTRHKEESWHNDAFYIAVILNNGGSIRGKVLEWSTDRKPGVLFIELALKRVGITRGEAGQRITASAIKMALNGHPWRKSAGLDRANRGRSRR